MAQLPPKVPSMTQNWHSSYQRMPIMANFISTTNNNTTNSAAATAIAQQQQPSWVDEFLDFSSARRGAHRRSMSDSVAFLEAPAFIDECRNSTTAMMHGTNAFDRLDDEQLMSMFSDDVSAVLPPPTVSSSNPSTPSDHNSIDDENKPIMAAMMHGTNAFDRLDDEQLMSMFSDDVSAVLPPPTVSSSNPSTPSDHNSIDDENKPIMAGLDHQPKNEPGEVESSCNPDPHAPPPSTTPSGDSPVDPKRVKRILANRQSAQRSRVRKLQYISELERSVTSLQTEVSALSPRVAFLDHQRLILNVDNGALKQRIAALAQDKLFKDAHQEALKKEIERLRQIYHQQNLKKMSNQNNAPSQPQPQPQPQPQQQPTSDHHHHHHPLRCTDKEHLLN
nr:bZIP3 protein [Betula platyphylla]